MKKSLLYFVIAMLFALSFVSCDKDDEPSKVFNADTLVNECPFFLSLNVNQAFYGLEPSEKVDCYEAMSNVDGVPMLNADIAWAKNGKMDSMIVVKDYPLAPVTKRVKIGDVSYSVNYYTITEEVFRDIIAKMKIQGIESKAYDDDFFTHKGKVYEYNRYENISSYDIKFDAPISITIRNGETKQAPFVRGEQDTKRLTLNCTLYYGDLKSGTAQSLNIHDFDWSEIDSSVDKKDMVTTAIHYFTFNDVILESIKEFMAEKGVTPVETTFPTE